MTRYCEWWVTAPSYDQKYATNIAHQSLWKPSWVEKIRSTLSEYKNGKFISGIEIRMPATKTDDKRIQIFIVRKAESKLDILLFAVRLSTWS